MYKKYIIFLSFSLQAGCATSLLKPPHITVDPIGFINKINECERTQREIFFRLKHYRGTKVKSWIVESSKDQFIQAGMQRINAYNKLIRHGYNPVKFNIYLHPLEKDAHKSELPEELIKLYLEILHIRKKTSETLPKIISDDPDISDQEMADFYVRYCIRNVNND